MRHGAAATFYILIPTAVNRFWIRNFTTQFQCVYRCKTILSSNCLALYYSVPYFNEHCQMPARATHYPNAPDQQPLQSGVSVRLGARHVRSSCAARLTSSFADPPHNLARYKFYCYYLSNCGHKRNVVCKDHSILYFEVTCLYCQCRFFPL